MAVNKTGAMFKSLTFDGEDSRDYGVYITGQAVFNAPEREVEMISIPGRNGQFALDKGRFENIEVTYPAGIFANTEADFAEAVSNFRNLLCSKRGYVRLQDEYHPDEYRMAIYKSGLELENVALKAGEFEITFDCKPQRYLTSGETETTVTNGGTLTNPTLFDAEPLLEVKGYGTIEFNGYEIEIENKPIGDIVVFDGYTQTVNSMPSTSTIDLDLDWSLLENDDPIMFSGVKESITISYSSNISQVLINTLNGMTETHVVSGRTITFYTAMNDVTLSFGNSETWSANIQADVYSGNSTYAESWFIDFNYNGFDTITVTFRQRSSRMSSTFTVPQIHATSSQSAITDWAYIDCALGECYIESSGNYISLNGYVSLGSDLPKLAPGGNEFTIDNTITELKVVPRYWKV